MAAYRWLSTTLFASVLGSTANSQLKMNQFGSLAMGMVARLRDSVGGASVSRKYDPDFSTHPHDLCETIANRQQQSGSVKSDDLKDGFGSIPGENLDNTSSSKGIGFNERLRRLLHERLQKRSFSTETPQPPSSPSSSGVSSAGTSFSSPSSPSSSSGKGAEGSSAEKRTITYGKAREEHKTELVTLLCESFVTREPIGLGLGVTREDFMTWAPRVVDELTDQGFSVVAQDEQTGKVVGFFLNEVERPGVNQGMGYSPHWCKNEKMNAIFNFLGDLDEKADPYRRFQVDKIFRFQMVGVDANYGNLGIARRLTDLSLETGIKESDCEVGVVECTGLFSQAIFKKYGFHSIAETAYATYRRPDGSSPFDLNRMGIHTDCKFMVKKLI